MAGRGGRSLKATYFQMVQGLTQVAPMQGGLEKWVRKGVPIRGAIPLGVVTAASCCGGPAPTEGTACDTVGAPADRAHAEHVATMTR